MKINPFPFLSAVRDSFDQMFIADKHGRLVFFPWIAKKQGYFVKDKNIVAKVKNFYTLLLSVYFITLLIAISIFYNFWSIVGLFFIWSTGLYFVYYLYTAHITKPLSVAKASYKEVVLEKLTSDETEELAQPDMQFPAHWNYPIPRIESDSLIGIRRIWYRLSPGHLFIASFFTGCLIAGVWQSYHPQKFSGQPEEFLVTFLVFFFWGLACFFMVKSGESPQTGVIGFIQWKLPMLFTMVVFFVLAALSFYKFIVALF